MRRVFAGVATATLLLAGSAEGAPSAQEKLREYTVQAQKLEAADEHKRFVEDLGTLRAWLSEAQAFVAQSEARAANRALARVAVQTRLLEALLARAAAEDAARQAHERADVVEKELADTRARATELERRQAELEEVGL